MIDIRLCYFNLIRLSQSIELIFFNVSLIFVFLLFEEKFEVHGPVFIFFYLDEITLFIFIFCANICCSFRWFETIIDSKL